MQPTCLVETTPNDSASKQQKLATNIAALESDQVKNSTPEYPVKHQPPSGAGDGSFTREIGYGALLVLFVVTICSYPHGYHSNHSLHNVWWCGWLTAVATGIGALPFFCIKSMDRFWLGICNVESYVALAAGMMLAATCCLFYEGFIFEVKDDFALSGSMRVLAGAFIGIVFIYATKRFLEEHEDTKFGGLEGLDARKAVLIMAVMTLHSLSEGIGMGVSFGGERGERRGFLVSVTLAIHNIPEGLAISLVLIPRGLSVMVACLWSIFSSMPQPLFALPAFIFVEKFLPVLPLGLGFAGGAMGYVAIMELLPESLEDTNCKFISGTSLVLSFVAMLNLQYVLTGEL